MAAESAAQALNEAMNGISRLNANITRQNGVCYLSIDRADGQGGELDPWVQRRLLQEWYRSSGHGDLFNADGSSLFK